MKKQLLLLIATFLSINISLFAQENEKIISVENIVSLVSNSQVSVTDNDKNTLAVRGRKSANTGVYEQLANIAEAEPIEPANLEKDLIGVVQNEVGEPLMFATIATYKDNRLLNGNTTSLSGVFELIIPSEATEIEVSYLGYQPKREKVQYFIDNPVVTLKKGTDLPEVIVLGYGSSRRSIWICDGNLIGRVAVDSILQVGFNATTWNVYPNPTLERITIKTVFQDGIFNLLSASGQVLKTISNDGELTEVNLNGYPAGHYYLRYQSETWSETFGPILKLKK